MALEKLPSALRRLVSKDTRQMSTSIGQSCRRYASTEAAVKTDDPEFEDLEKLTSYTPVFPAGEDKINAYDPVKRVQQRKRQLPPSRYQYKSPRYFRGPLHPHQPPPTSDPASREYVPGPFNYTRLEQTYQAMIAPDLMTMTYVHTTPGTVKLQKSERLRTWDDSSPYHKGRPKRGPRGPGQVLRLVEQDIDWRSVPKIEEVTVHTMVKGAIEDSAHLHVAGMFLQAITGARPTVHKARHSVAQFGIRERMPIALTSTIRGNQAYEFVDKCIHLVCPRIKDWPGVEGSTGDSSGNITFGFGRDGAILFPEVEVNYDMYPPKMIPGFHVTVKTTAKSDRHARLLFQAFGLPFTGKLID